MRRNVRRLNREIGNHGSSLPVSTQVSLPQALPTSYQPRSQEKKIMSDIKTVVNTTGNLPANVPLSPTTSNSSISDGDLSVHRPSSEKKLAAPSVSVSANQPILSANNSNNGNQLSSAMKKKNVRKAVNLSELQRYFHAAEEAAREIMLEDAINAQLSGQGGSMNDEKNGVFQLTTLTTLPLKSPKRLIALQLANSNASFRDRFKHKLEQSGGLMNIASSDHAVGAAGVSFGGGNGSSNNSTAAVTVTTGNSKDFNNAVVGNTDAWPTQGGVTASTLTTNARASKGHGQGTGEEDDEEEVDYHFIDREHEDSQLSVPGTNEKVPKKRGRKSKADKEREARQTVTFSGHDQIDDEEVPAGKVAKLRQKRRKSSAQEVTDGEGEDDYQYSKGSSDTGSNGGSIIKRRRKGELQIMVDGGLGLSMNNPSTTTTTNSSSTGTNSNSNNLHSLVGGGLNTFGDMGPPETQRRSSRLLKSGALSSLSNLSTFAYLDSPFFEKSLTFPDVFGSGASGGPLDTPTSKLIDAAPLSAKSMQLLAGFSSVGPGGEPSVRFDFDEAIAAAHFPSPRAGEVLHGNSPYRWSTRTSGSGFFNFPDSTLGNSAKNASFGNLSEAVTGGNNAGEGADQAPPGTTTSMYAKKFKKAHKLEQGQGGAGGTGNTSSDSIAFRDKRESDISNMSVLDDLSFQSPASGTGTAHQSSKFGVSGEQEHEEEGEEGRAGQKDGQEEVKGCGVYKCLFGVSYCGLIVDW